MTADRRPEVLVLDVNGTLSDLSALAGRFEDVGAPGALLDLWFANVLRDGFALTAAGAYAPFTSVAGSALKPLLRGLDGWTGDPDAAADHVLGGFPHLPVHPDVPDGLWALRDAGYRLVTLTNSSAAATEELLAHAGLAEYVEAHLDVSGPRRWKPAPDAYRFAAAQTGVAPERCLLVAAHPWDVDGARRAGLAAAWLRRGAGVYPDVMTPPTLVAPDLRELARLLASA